MGYGLEFALRTGVEIKYLSYNIKSPLYEKNKSKVNWFYTHGLFNFLWHDMHMKSLELLMHNR